MKFQIPFTPEQASTIASEVDSLYVFSLAVSAFFSLLIAAVVLIFFIRYRRRSERETGVPVHGSVALEITWSVIPLVITMVLFGWGAKVFIQARNVPADAREYFATGKQWMWKFQHPEGQREINTLHVPVGERIQLTMTSEDVIHSFFVPAFRVKQDVLPGRYTTLWFEATKTGTFHLFCTEYCGAEHAQMIGSVIVMEPEDYADWLAGTGDVVAPKSAGAGLFEQYTCNTCHYDDGSGRGPSLVGIMGEEVRLADGRTVVRDDNYIRESILHPNEKLVEGYLQIMPTFQGQISEVGVRQLISYIKSLGPPEGQSGAAVGAAVAAADAEATTPGEEPATGE